MLPEYSTTRVCAKLHMSICGVQEVPIMTSGARKNLNSAKVAIGNDSGGHRVMSNK